ncbi:MAG TPA: DUF6485 family protein [Candidatus Deferrimicrobium sp.]|nr:DUF6485 family protein [Candidatus Deferrimicrobium sp.]
MECKKNTNLQHCNCTYEPCSRKGICCECIEYHRRAGELPACYFSAKAERTYDRSIRKFIQDQGK